MWLVRRQQINLSVEVETCSDCSSVQLILPKDESQLRTKMLKTKDSKDKQKKMLVKETQQENQTDR